MEYDQKITRIIICQSCGRKIYNPDENSSICIFCRLKGDSAKISSS